MRFKTKMPEKGTRGAKFIKKKGANLPLRKRYCRFCVDKVKSIDYKDMKRLEAFIRDSGKIVSSRFSGNCAKHQRMITRAINKARFISLLPYTYA